MLIDSQVFSESVAKRAAQGAAIAARSCSMSRPSVWAWKPERAPALRPLFDEVLAVLPFEPAVMQRLGGPPTSYVGHPALEHSTLRAAQPERGPLLLLPGSRRGELRRHLPLMHAGRGDRLRAPSARHAASCCRRRATSKQRIVEASRRLGGAGRTWRSSSEAKRAAFARRRRGCRGDRHGDAGAGAGRGADGRDLCRRQRPDEALSASTRAVRGAAQHPARRGLVPEIIGTAPEHRSGRRRR